MSDIRHDALTLTGPTLTRSTLTTAYFAPDANARWDAHTHPVHEMLWGTEGSVTVETEHGLYAVPPLVGLWLPAGLEHTVQSSAGTGFFCTFVDAPSPRGDRPGPSIVAVTPLMRELLDHLRREGMPADVRSSAESVVVHLLALQDVEPLVLPFPRDGRLVAVCRALIDDPGDERSLEQWGRQVGASSRTLSRLFRAETGVTFEQWRIHARVRVAIGLLGRGTPVGIVAGMVGYQTTSAFVHTFRTVMGHTPGRYLSAETTDTRHSLAGHASHASATAHERKLG